jgi:hypothetical protein
LRRAKVSTTKSAPSSASRRSVAPTRISGERSASTTRWPRLTIRSRLRRSMSTYASVPSRSASLWAICQRICRPK